MASLEPQLCGICKTNYSKIDPNPRRKRTWYCKYCEKCSNPASRISLYRVKNLVGGLCIRCSKNPIKLGTKYCQVCSNLYNLTQQARRIQVKRKLIAHLGGRCYDCGFICDYTEVFDFHHTNPSKKQNYFNTLLLTTWEKILEEVALGVVVLCANCHRLRHAKEHELKREKARGCSGG